MSAEGVSEGRSARHRGWRRVAGFLVIVVALVVVWEAAKLVSGDPWRIEAEVAGVQISFFHDPPFRWRLTNDQSLPHVWEIAGTLTRPIQPGRPPLALLLADNALFTLRGAAMGFALGAGFGLLLGTALAILASRLVGSRDSLRWIWSAAACAKRSEKDPDDVGRHVGRLVDNRRGSIARRVYRRVRRALG